MHWKMIPKSIKIHPKSIPNRPKWCPGALRKRSWKQVVFKLPKMALRLPRFFRSQVFAIIWRTSGVNLGAFWELSASVWVPKMATKLTHLAPKLVPKSTHSRIKRASKFLQSSGSILGAKCVSSGPQNCHKVDALSSQSNPEFALLGAKRPFGSWQSSGRLHGSICNHFGS